MRIGHGFDAHAFTPNKPLVLGGVKVPDHSGLKAHSDGDALIHAICDALLGAAALGDIGHYFPSSDERLKDVDSRTFLRQVITLINDHHYSIANIDATVITQKPKLAMYIDAMKKCLAEDMLLKINQINIKATTTDGLGFTGREEGIAVHAVVLLDSN